MMPPTIEDLALAEAVEFINGNDFSRKYDLVRIGDHASVTIEVERDRVPGELAISLSCCAFEPRLVDWSKLLVLVKAGVTGFDRLSRTGVLRVVLESTAISSLTAKAVECLRVAVGTTKEAGVPLLFAAAAAEGAPPADSVWKDIVLVSPTSDLQVALQLRDGILIVGAFTTSPAASVGLRITDPGGNNQLIEVPLSLESEIPLTVFEKLKLEPAVRKSLSGYIGIREVPVEVTGECRALLLDEVPNG